MCEVGWGELNSAACAVVFLSAGPCRWCQSACNNVAGRMSAQHLIRDGDDTRTTQHKTWQACSSSSGMLMWCWSYQFRGALRLPLLTDWSWWNEVAVYWYLQKGRVLFCYGELLWMLRWTVLLVFLWHATSWLKVKLLPLHVLLESKLRIRSFKRGMMGSHWDGGEFVLYVFFIFTRATCWMTVCVSDDTLTMTLEVM